MKKNLVFIGMPAVGKSTVGIVVAKRLGMNFIDVDLLIQEQEHKLLREIIAEEGQEGFLKIENRINASLQAENSVISPGGSVIYCEEAMRHYKKIGIIVYLKASYPTIKRRIRNPKKRVSRSKICTGSAFRISKSTRILPYARTAAGLKIPSEMCSER